MFETVIIMRYGRRGILQHNIMNHMITEVSVINFRGRYKLQHLSLYEHHAVKSHDSSKFSGI